MYIILKKHPNTTQPNNDNNIIISDNFLQHPTWVEFCADDLLQCYYVHDNDCLFLDLLLNDL